MQLYEIITISLLVLILLGIVTMMLESRSFIFLKRKPRQILLDTSVLIDGRILSVARSGFLGGRLIIPRSVTRELQFLADNGDQDKRLKARHGLDVALELQAMTGVDVEILRDDSSVREGVDERLIALARSSGADICTIDYNLNKVAAVEGVTVLNINELAQQLRMAHLPGEKINLELVQKGQESHQAVGYLPDGTMVVVENAQRQIGKGIEVEIIRSLQTAAGRMMFARPIEKPAQAPQSKKSSTSKKASTKSSSSKNSKDRKQTGRRPSAKPKDPESSLINLIEKS